MAVGDIFLDLFAVGFGASENCQLLSMHIWDEASVCLDPYLRQGNMIQDSGILVSKPTTVEALLLLDLPGTEQCSLTMVIS